jgi:hypothetical protein
MRDHAHTLSDFLVPTLSIECEPCGRRGRYNVARLMEKYGDAKLPDAAACARRLPEGEIVQLPLAIHSRSSLATATGALSFFAAFKAAFSSGLRSSASAPLPVSTSVNSATTAKPSASAKAAIADFCASRPRPDRPCFWVDTR